MQVDYGFASLARRAVRRLGIDVRRWREVAGYDLAPFYGRAAFLRQLGVTVTLDVGANRGQWAAALRSAEYHGRIISFEPLSEPYAHLARRAQSDALWDVHHVALGDRGGEAVMHVAEDRAGSSFLAATSQMITTIPAMARVAEETVQCQRLDEFSLPTGACFLKADVQGYERWVLEGASGVLAKIVGIELELSFTHLYEGDMGIRPMLNYLAETGYELRTVIPGVVEPVAELPLQVDGIFVRSA